jgi:tRNA pseudouridine38-40 synthase
MRYLIEMCFTGDGYHGWQEQSNASNTVQRVTASAIQKVLRHPVNLTGCGRTDKGVHARQFFAHFDFPGKDLTTHKTKYLFGINSTLPSSISIRDIYHVSDDFNARFSAISRTYRYIITSRKDPFLAGMAYLYPFPLDIKRMNIAAASLKTYKEFSSFKKVNTQVKTDECMIMHAEWEAKDDTLVFTITANRFLRNMVRAIVGTMLEVGRGKKTVSDFCRIIESKNRSHAGVSVPAHGLYLISVKYPQNLFAGESL